MWRRNQNAARLVGPAVTVYSERGLAGAARAERRALPTRVSSDRQLRLLPQILMNCGSFQSIPNTFVEIMKRSAENLNEACLVGWAVSVGSERGLVGESGVAAPALPPQSKTRWLQPALPWADDMMCRGLAVANSVRFDGLRRVPVSSNQFQSLFGKLCRGEIKTQHVWRGGRSLLAASDGWQAKAVSSLPLCHRSPKHDGCRRCCLGQAT